MNLIDEPIDYFILALKLSPGIAEFPSGASSPRKWDKRKGYGVSGSSIVYTGDDLASFTVKIKLRDALDWADWDEFAPLLFKPPNATKPKAMDIWHPILEAHSIRSVVVEDLTGPTQGDPGFWIWEVKFLQYRAPKPALAKPAASAAKPANAKPLSEADKIIQSLTGQLQELAK